jgi:hypothetical protein
MKILERGFDALFPPAAVLHQRGGAREADVEIEPGHSEVVPFFDLTIEDVRHVGEEPIKAHGRTIGYTVLEAIRLSDNIERGVRVNIPYNLQGDFSVTDGAAFTTKNTGYGAHRAREIVKTVEEAVIQVDAEHSTRQLPIMLEATRLPQTLASARTISLAKSAEAEELMIDHVMREYGLPQDHYVIGDSRKAMISLMQYVYAARHNNPIRYLDVKAPCIPDKLQYKDIPEVLGWGATEILGGVAVVAGLVRCGELHTLRGTASLEPNFVVSSLVGVMPALATGSDTARLIPKTADGHVVVYGRDKVSRAEQWEERFEAHPNIHVKTVPKGTHGNLLDPKARNKQVERIGRFGEIFGWYGGDTSAFNDLDREYIRHGKAASDQGQLVA